MMRVWMIQKKTQQNAIGISYCCNVRFVFCLPFFQHKLFIKVFWFRAIRASLRKGIDWEIEKKQTLIFSLWYIWRKKKRSLVECHFQLQIQIQLISLVWGFFYCQIFFFNSFWIDSNFHKIHTKNAVFVQDTKKNDAQHTKKILPPHAENVLFHREQSKDCMLTFQVWYIESHYFEHNKIHSTQW